MSDENTNKFSLIDLPDSLDGAVKNLTDQPTKNAGQTLGDIWYLVFGGLSHMADKKRMKYAQDLENYRKELEQSIRTIPKEKKIEPSIQVTAQALENSKYCVSSKTLRSMFTNLIVGTMNSDLEPLIHPSFPEIIKQMNENDAHLLMELKTKTDLIPIAEFREKFNENNEFITLFSNAYISNQYNLSLDDCSCSLSFLERMGLITISYQNCLSVDSMYLPFIETTFYKRLEEEINCLNRNSCVALYKGFLDISPLGKRFIETCVP